MPPRKAKPLTEEQIKAAVDRAEGKVDDAPAEHENGAGRISAYEERFADIAKELCELGATDAEVADYIGISTRTLNRWKGKYPKFCLSIKSGKEVADERVMRSLYHKANGYTFEAEEIFQYQGEIVRAKVTKHVPPDTVACIFWLKNRRPDLWREKVDVEHSGNVALGDRLDTSLKRIAEQPVKTTQH